MKIYNPEVELWTPENTNQHVARCARVCYGKETGNDENTIKHLHAAKHNSMFRHDTKYIIIDTEDKNVGDNAKYFANLYYDTIYNENKICGINIKFDDGKYYIVVNGNWIIDHPAEFMYFSPYIVFPEYFANTEIGFNMMRYTFACITQISTSRELNRVSPNNIAESSTRYIYEDGSIVRPWWMNEYAPNKYNSEVYNNRILSQYLDNCDSQFKNYKQLVEAGMHNQDARGVLPLDTKTKVVYTYSVDEWKEIINLRYYGTTGKPHGNAHIIASLIRDELNELGYNI